MQYDIINNIEGIFTLFQNQEIGVQVYLDIIMYRFLIRKVGYEHLKFSRDLDVCGCGYIRIKIKSYRKCFW